MASSPADRLIIAADQKLSTSELLYRCARHMGLQPQRLLPSGLFSVSIGAQETYINVACSPLNSQSSARLAKNKYLTRLILEHNQLPNIPFARPQTMEEAETFLARHHKIIAKPVAGAGSHDIHIITQARDLQALTIRHYILERYVAGKELRYLVLNGDVIGVYRSAYGTSVAQNRPLKCIAYPRTAWDDVLVALSLRVTETLGLKFAAVDYLVDARGTAHILEVNTTPDIKWFHAPSSGPVVDVARLFLEAMVEHAQQIPTILPSFRTIPRQGYIVRV